MPRRRLAPRLYLDPQRRTWSIKDGALIIRTGCAEREREGAEKRLHEYLGHKYKPEPSPCPLIVDVLLAYSNEHLPHTRSRRNATYGVQSLSAYWGDKRTSDVTARTCRGYTEMRTPSAARRDLQTLRAAIGYWHRNYGPLPALPVIVMPPAEQPRERWLTRQEAARLLRAARQTAAPYLARMILIGLYTGSRMRTILRTEWNWIDLDHGLMLRRAPGATETKKRTPPVRIGHRILAHLRRWRRMDGPNSIYVCHYDGRAVDYPYVAWRKAVKRAGLGKGVSPHTLRHTRATWGMQRGVDPWQLAGHLGMTLQTLTRVYGKHSPSYQKEAAEF
jgi:integrase